MQMMARHLAIGFDCEWNARNPTSKVPVVQIAYKSNVHVLQPRAGQPLPSAIKALLGSSLVQKVARQVSGDLS